MGANMCQPWSGIDHPPPLYFNRNRLYTHFAHLIARLYYQCSGFTPIDSFQRENGVAEIRGAVIRDPAFISFCCVEVVGFDISQGNPAPRLNEAQLRLFHELMPSSMRSHNRD